MACFEYGTIIDLTVRETVTLGDVRGATLRVARGTLWITQEGDAQDVVLRTGDTWTVERNDLTVLEAQSDVSFCVMGRRVDALVTTVSEGSMAARGWDKVRGAVAAFLASPTRGTAPYV
jgi:hypothetical protein